MAQSLCSKARLALKESQHFLCGQSAVSVPYSYDTADGKPDATRDSSLLANPAASAATGPASAEENEGLDHSLA